MRTADFGQMAVNGYGWGVYLTLEAEELWEFPAMAFIRLSSISTSLKTKNKAINNTGTEHTQPGLRL